MEGVVRWAIIGGIGLTWMALGADIPAAEPRIIVEYAPPHLTVRIPEATDLHTVLAAVCAQTQARCELPAPAAAVPVAPTTVTGSWGEVVAKLLAGAGLSFTAAPAAGASGAQLVVLGPSGPEAGPAAPASVLDQPPAAPLDDPSRSSGPGLGPEAAPPPGAADVEQGPSPLPGDASRAGAGPGQNLAAGQTAVPAPGTMLNPFFGPPGHPAGAPPRPPARPETTMVLPFPDAQGNPIVVTIPTEPLTVFPFPGPDGQPVPVPLPQPGQQVGWPFPPTPGAPNP